MAVICHTNMDSIFNEIDAAIGTELSHLSRVPALLSEAKLKRDAIQAGVDALLAPTASVGEAVKDAKNALCELDASSERSAKVSSSLVEQRNAPAALELSLGKLAREINALNRIERYLQCVRCVDTLGRAVANSIAAGDLDGALQPYAILASVRRSVAASSCTALAQYVAETTNHLHASIKKRLFEDGTAALSAIEWPSSLSTAKHEVTSVWEPKISICIDRLLRLQLADVDAADSTALPGGSSKSATPTTTLPRDANLHAIDLLLEPVTKRFRYHFGGKRQTNRKDKPEWFFTHALNLIRDGAPFIARVVQPILAERGLTMRDAEYEYAEGVVALVAGKVASLLPKVISDDDPTLFSHLINETLLFERELSLFGFPPPHSDGAIGIAAEGLKTAAADADRGVCGRCVAQIAAPAHLDRWLEAEWLLANGRFERVMASPSAWQPRYGAFEDVDELRAPECASQLVGILQAVTDRYMSLRSPVDRLRFFETIQERLLVEFHGEIVDFIDYDIRGDSAWERTQLCRLANAAHYVRSAMAEWADQMFFLEIHHKRSGLADQGRQLVDVTGTLFDDLISRYDAIIDIAVERLTETGHSRFAAALKPHLAAKTKYLLTSANAEGLTEISALLYEPLAVASEHITLLRASLAQPLLDRAWQDFARILSERSLHRELILTGKFNAHGVIQLGLDATAIYSVFRELTAKPENYLKEFKEAVILLKQNAQAIGRLLRTLNGSDAHVTRRALDDIGVFRLEPADALAVLARHLDGGAKP
eukprot:Opistho-2@5931